MTPARRAEARGMMAHGSMRRILRERPAVDPGPHGDADKVGQVPNACAYAGTHAARQNALCRCFGAGGTGARPLVAMIAARAASVGRSRGEMLGIFTVRAVRRALSPLGGTGSEFVRRLV